MKTSYTVNLSRRRSAGREGREGERERESRRRRFLSPSLVDEAAAEGTGRGRANPGLCKAMTAREAAVAAARRRREKCKFECVIYLPTP